MSWSEASLRVLLVLLILGTLWLFLSQRRRNQRTWWRTSSHPSFFAQHGVRQNYEDSN